MSFGSCTSPRILLSATLALGLAFLLTGCTLATTGADSPTQGLDLRGTVYGGQQPIVGAQIYLYAATVSGVGSAGYGLASASLLNSNVVTNNPSNHGEDASNRYYVTTDSAGGFSLAGDFTCPSANSQLYLYALGGNPGAGTNTHASLMAALGSCGSIISSTTIIANELTTVAAAYALSGFATDATHVSIPKYASIAMQMANTTDALAQTGLQNAFATADNLVSTSTGQALTATPNGNGQPDTSQVITLGNILAACINTNGTIAGPTGPSTCYTLFNNAGSAGGGSGTIPSDTATSVINIAHHPYVSSTVTNNLFDLQPALGQPYVGGQSSAPSDFTIGISYTGGGLVYPFGVAVDAAGNVWMANDATSVSEFNNAGMPLSGANGYPADVQSGSLNIAIDLSGNAWITAGNVVALTPSGSALPGSPFDAGGNISESDGVSVDGTGNIWVTDRSNELIELTSAGAAIGTYTGNGLNTPSVLGIDVSGNLWVPNENDVTISEFSNAGAPIPHSPFSGAALDAPSGVALDNAGHVWAANSQGSSLSELSSTGAAIGNYGGCGLSLPYNLAIDGGGNIWVADGNAHVAEFSNSGAPLCATEFTSGQNYGPGGVAVDGSGNVWLSSYNGNGNISEIVGAATPVVTPIAASLIAPYSAAASRP
jgi:streptogramin lyase